MKLSARGYNGSGGSEPELPEGEFIVIIVDVDGPKMVGKSRSVYVMLGCEEVREDLSKGRRTTIWLEWDPHAQELASSYTGKGKFRQILSACQITEDEVDTSDLIGRAFHLRRESNNGRIWDKKYWPIGSSDYTSVIEYQRQHYPDMQ